MIKNIGRMFFTLLIGVVVFISLPQRSAMAQTVDDETLIHQTIDAYLVLKYEGLTTLSPQNFGQQVASNARAQRFLRAEKDKREIDYFKASLFRLNYQSYDYTLNIQSFELSADKNSATVVLLEEQKIVFEVSAPTVSEMGLQHTFSMVKENGAWKIVEDSYEDDLARFIKLNHLTKAQVMQIIVKNYQADQQMRKRQSATHVRPQLSMTGNTYNGYLAATWANNNYVNGYNSYNGYNGNGSDCTNFVSWAIANGGAGGGVPETSPENVANITNGWFFSSMGLSSESWRSSNTFVQNTLGTTWKNMWTTAAPDGTLSTLAGMDYGDVVGWNLLNIGTIDHVAIMTSYSAGDHVPLFTDRQNTNPPYHHNIPYTYYSNYGVKFINITEY